MKVKPVKKFKKCPFCKQAIKPEPWQLSEVRPGRWNYFHYCETGDRLPGVSISVYGASKDEVIERWNRRAANVQEHIAD